MSTSSQSDFMPARRLVSMRSAPKSHGSTNCSRGSNHRSFLAARGLRWSQALIVDPGLSDELLVPSVVVAVLLSVVFRLRQHLICDIVPVLLGVKGTPLALERCRRSRAD